MKRLGLVLAAAAMVAFAGSAMAHHGIGGHSDDGSTGNGAISGAHYNLNIIGVSHDKTADMTGSKRHTIFVGLGTKGGSSVRTDIYLTNGDFEVCDGNGFDTATDCDGVDIGSIKKTGAVFQLPCNTNITVEGDTILVACGDTTSGNATAAYRVFARALGTPGGEATITTCVEDFDEQNGPSRLCSLQSEVLVRDANKPTFKDVTQALTSLLVDGDPKTRYALFEGDFEDWLWQYDNKGLRLAQLRFYFVD